LIVNESLTLSLRWESLAMYPLTTRQHAHPSAPGRQLALIAGTAAGWPAEVLGFWIAALRVRDAFLG
jgi:hypothetical protein